jgi:alpha-beta hydrolase superfamily lysophospholipase
LASALAGRGIATLRYDKRGIGQSQGYREESITLMSSAHDLVALIREAQSKEPFSTVTLVGHSEGGVVAMKAVEDIHPAGLVLVAVPGRTLGAVLRDQLAKRGVPASDVDKALLDLRKGDAVLPTVPALRLVFRPGVLPFLRSIIDVDPAALVRATTLPIAVVQGDNDRQLSVDDAELLHAARPDARLVIVKNMSHVLKDDPSQSSPQRSYTDPTMPLAAPVIDVIAEMAKR